MWKATVLRGLFFSKVVQISYLFKGWGKESRRSARGWDQLGAGQNPPNVHFFLRVKEYLFCIEWWGDPGGEFELQAIWSRVAFLQTLGVRISESPPHPHMSSRLLP